MMNSLNAFVSASTRQLMLWTILAGMLSIVLWGVGGQSMAVEEVHHPAQKNVKHQLGQLMSSLQATWPSYKARFIQDDGRVKDPRTGDSTTSEGQAYALLRAVWMQDRTTFERVYAWSVDNLQTPRGDQLFAWKWGKHDDGSWGVLDKTAASDADQDIALALLMADHRWQKPAYREAALAILNEFWDKLTLETVHGRVLLPGDWFSPSDKPKSIQWNPSYCAPYAYRVFAEVDPSHPWEDLTASCYRLTAQALSLTGTGLPPDWVAFSTLTGQMSLYGSPTQDDARSDFGYEAFRAPWRWSLDAWLAPTLTETTAQPLIQRTANALSRQLRLRRTLPGVLTPEGIERKVFESSAVYGALYPVVSAVYPELDAVLWSLGYEGWQWDETQGLWRDTSDYYAQNWLAFGLHLRIVQLAPPDRHAKTSLAKLTTLGTD